MGNGIAHVFARSGYNVFLCDVEQRFLDRGLDTIAKNHSLCGSLLVLPLAADNAPPPTGPPTFLRGVEWSYVDTSPQHRQSGCPRDGGCLLPGPITTAIRGAVGRTSVRSLHR